MPLSRDPRIARFVLVLPLATILACGGPAAPAPAPASAPSGTTGAGTQTARPPSPAPPLPPVPEVDGPLTIQVVYPTPNQQLASRDSNFIFGSIGSGRASLTVNDVPARVYPNGAFIAYLANPPASVSRYDLLAVRGPDTVRSTQPIRLVGATPRRPPPPAAPPAAPNHLDGIGRLEERLDSLKSLLARDEPIGAVQLGAAAAVGDTDLTIIGRPTPGGTYKWFFTPGTVVPLMERTDGYARVRLDKGLDVYVDANEAHDVAPPARPFISLSLFFDGFSRWPL